MNELEEILFVPCLTFAVRDLHHQEMLSALINGTQPTSQNYKLVLSRSRQTSIADAAQMWQPGTRYQKSSAQQRSQCYCSLLLVASDALEQRWYLQGTYRALWPQHMPSSSQGRLRAALAADIINSSWLSLPEWEKACIVPNYGIRHLQHDRL